MTIFTTAFCKLSGCARRQSQHNDVGLCDQCYDREGLRNECSDTHLTYDRSCEFCSEKEFAAGMRAEMAAAVLVVRSVQRGLRARLIKESTGSEYTDLQMELSCEIDRMVR